MPLITFPAGIIPAQTNWQLERFDTRFDAQAGTFQTSTIPGARWRCTLSFPPLKRADSGPLQAFLAQVSDLGNRFLMPDFAATLIGTGGGTPLVKGAGQTGRYITTEGWTDGQLVLRAGDMVQLGDNRLHLVTVDVTSGSSGTVLDELGAPLLDELGNPITVEGEGNAVVQFEPALQSSPADATPILTGLNAKAVFMLDGGYAAASTPGIFTGISIEVVQDLSWSA